MESLRQARRAFCACKFNEAAELFGKALETIVDDNLVSEQKAASSMIYYQYALSLVRGRQEEMKSTDSDGPEEKAEEEEDDDDSEGTGEDREVEVSIQPGTSKDTGVVEKDKNEENTEDDLDVAWDVLEISRIVFEKNNTNNDDVRLIMVLSLEAELVALNCSYAVAIEQLDLALNVLDGRSESLKALKTKILLQKAVYQLKLLNFSGVISSLDDASMVVDTINEADSIKEMLKEMKTMLEEAVEENDPEQQEKQLKTLACQMLIAAEFDIAVAFLPFGALLEEESTSAAKENEKPAVPLNQTRDISHLIRRKSLPTGRPAVVKTLVKTEAAKSNEKEANGNLIKRPRDENNGKGNDKNDDPDSKKLKS